MPKRARVGGTDRIDRGPPSTECGSAYRLRLRQRHPRAGTRHIRERCIWDLTQASRRLRVFAARCSAPTARRLGPAAVPALERTAWLHDAAKIGETSPSTVPCPGLSRASTSTTTPIRAEKDVGGRAKPGHR